MSQRALTGFRRAEAMLEFTEPQWLQLRGREIRRERHLKSVKVRRNLANR